MDPPSRRRPAGSSREPNTKGTSLLPLVVALKNLPNWREIVPEPLWTYFEGPIIVSSWYPERDYFTLIETLVGTVDPQAVGGDVWRFFGITAAQRDIGGTENTLPKEARVRPGLYQSFKTEGPAEIGQFVKRAIMLWDQYHDTGKMVIHGGRRTTNSLVARLIGFAIPVHEYLVLQAAYTEEYARLVGIGMHGAVTRSTARGDPFCEWEYTFARTPASEAYIASLSPLPDG